MQWIQRISEIKYRSKKSEIIGIFLEKILNNETRKKIPSFQSMQVYRRSRPRRDRGSEPWIS